jgi:hypothetical protein
MKPTTTFRRTALLLGVALLAGACSPPKYAHYTSVKRDWQADVPWAWNIITENDGSTYGNTAVIGPFDPDFYLGAPSFQVRWYSYSSPHKMRDGEYELYSSVDNFIQQTLELTYGVNREFKQPVHDIDVAGRNAKHFVVLSSRPAPKWAKWGTSINNADHSVGILREHAYVVLPLTRGFYVLIYPATQAGYKLYEKNFNELVHSFNPLTEGPDGPRAVAPKGAHVKG